MLKKFACFILSLLAVLPLFGCSNETSSVETPIIETTEAVIEESMIPTSTMETITSETEPKDEILLTPNGDEIIRILYLDIDSLSIREGPDSGYSLLDSYRRGEEILVIDETDNGWLKVYFIDYNDEEKVGYCFNGYRYFKEPCDDSVNLEADNPVETISEDEKYAQLALENLGNYGRLLIPDANISCQLNLVDSESSDASSMAQYYTDIEDSAAFFKYGNMYVISDHREQGFANLEKVVTNNIAYIGSGEKVIALYCYKTQYGKNSSDILLTDHNENGTGFDGYLIYTFSDTKDGYDIYMTYWREKTW